MESHGAEGERVPALDVGADGLASGGRDNRSGDDEVIGEIPKWLNGADCKSAGLWPTEVRILLSPPESRRRIRRVARRAHRRIEEGSGHEIAGIAQLARAPAFQAGGRGFESRFPLQNEVEARRAGRPSGSRGGRRSRIEGEGSAHVAQVVEHVLGKDEVSGSSPLVSSRRRRPPHGWWWMAGSWLCWTGA